MGIKKSTGVDVDLKNPAFAQTQSRPYSKMKHIAAYLLCVLGGNASPSAGDVEKILASVGAEADSEKLTKLMGELEGKNIEEVIAAGTEKLASVPCGAAAAAEEEKKEESEEESDDDMGFSLFD